MQTRNIDDYKSSQSTFNNEMNSKFAPVYELTLYVRKNYVMLQDMDVALRVEENPIQPFFVHIPQMIET